MKTKAKELRNLTDDELKQKVVSMREELIKLRSQATLGRLEKPSQIKQARRTIAMVETILKEKKDAGASAQ